MLLLSFRPGTNVKAPGFGRLGQIVGFIADDDGQWRIVVPFLLVGGEGDLRRDFAPAELEIVPEDRNAVLEACATALLGHKGHALDNHPAAGTLARERSREALEDARVVLEALAGNLSADVLDAAQDVREGRPDWRILRHLDFVAITRAHKRIVVAAIRRAAWRPWTG